MRTLYEIADEYKFLLDELYDEETGEVNDKALARLNELSDPMENKCINIVKVFKEFEKEAKAIEEERKRLQKREKAYKNQVERLKTYLSHNMEKCGIKKIECPQFVISLHKNPIKLQIDDEESIPQEYKKVIYECDNEKIKSELMNGVVIAGARLVQGVNVRIR